MIFDGTLFDSFQEQYGVRNIETRVESVSPFFSGGSLGGDRYYRSQDNTEVSIEMSGAGFRQMMRDLFQPSNVGNQYFRTTFEVDKLELPDDKPWIAKFDMERHDLEAVKVLADKLIEEFPGQQIIFFPKDINIEALGSEGIVALRDYLNGIIEALNYDNIMGF